MNNVGWLISLDLFALPVDPQQSRLLAGTQEVEKEQETH